MVRLIMWALLCVAACGNVSRGQDDAGMVYDAAIDTPSPPSDAAQDAAPLKEARELVSGGARTMSATYTLDVEVGHGAQQGRSTSPSYKLEGNTAVRP
jgi:hypothetical protein